MRKLVSISAVSSTVNISGSPFTYETLYGLADDGTAWEYKVRIGVRSDHPPQWRQIPALPEVEKEPVSESVKAARSKLAKMD